MEFPPFTNFPAAPPGISAHRSPNTPGTLGVLVLLVCNNVSEIVGSFCLMRKRETSLAFSRGSTRAWQHWGLQGEAWGPKDLRAMVLPPPFR